MFAQWINKERDFPGFIIPELASVLGADSKVLKLDALLLMRITF
jgi:hypothetical protein